MSSASIISDSPESTQQPKLGGMPTWVPVSLIAVTTIALAVPLVLLRRGQGSAPATRLATAAAAPPPRRGSRILPSLPATPATFKVVPSSTSSAPPPRRVPNSGRGLTKPEASNPTTINHPSPLPQPAPVAASSESEEGAETEAEPDVLMGVKAFGYATLAVTAGTMVTIWGVRTALGVNTAEEFGLRMRQELRAHLPSLADGIYGDADIDPILIPVLPASGDTEWNWMDAESRLSESFEREGLEAWFKSAARELAVETALERRRREELIAAQSDRKT